MSRPDNNLVDMLSKARLAIDELKETQITGSDAVIAKLWEQEFTINADSPAGRWKIDITPEKPNNFIFIDCLFEPISLDDILGSDYVVVYNANGSFTVYAMLGRNYSGRNYAKTFKINYYGKATFNATRIN